MAGRIEWLRYWNFPWQDESKAWIMGQLCGTLADLTCILRAEPAGADVCHGGGEAVLRRMTLVINTYPASRAHDPEGVSPSGYSLAWLARLSWPRHSLSTATVRVAEVARRKPSRAETSTNPPSSRYPGPGLRLAVCSDPVQTVGRCNADRSPDRWGSEHGLGALPGGVTGRQPSTRCPGSGSQRRSS